MTHNCSANFKLIHFLLWTKESHQSPNFDIFKCSGENLPNSSCHFSNHKSVFLQILHHSTGFPNWGRLVGGQLGQNGQKLHENYIIDIFGSKQWGEGSGGRQVNFWGSGGDPH